MEDDHYDNFLIPKGATIMANNYAISRDAEIFPDPESFKPTRFLDDSLTRLRTDILNPMEFAFGFGRRTCPGRYLADSLLFCHFAHILKVFDVSLPPEGDKAKRAADAKMKVKSNGAAWCVSLRPRVRMGEADGNIQIAGSRRSTSLSRRGQLGRLRLSTKIPCRQTGRRTQMTTPTGVLISRYDTTFFGT